MVSRWTALDAQCSPNAPFALLYLNVTNQSIVAIQNGYFNDGNTLVSVVRMIVSLIVDRLRPGVCS